MKQKILITGTQGFIGNHLKQKLNNDFIISEINESIFDTKNWIEELVSLLNNENPDVIFHIGACSNTLETDVNYIMKVNFEFTKRLTDLTKFNNKKIIYSSSASSYGNDNNYPSNLYGWSKYTAETYVTSNGGIALRYFNVYGLGETHKGKMSSVIHQVLNSESNDFGLFPKKPKRDFVYVKDVIEANIFAMKNYQELKSNYYDVGFGEPRPFEDIITILNKQYYYLDESLIPKHYQFFTCSNPNKWMPNWKPQFSLELGIQDMKNNLNS